VATCLRRAAAGLLRYQELPCVFNRGGQGPPAIAFEVNGSKFLIGDFINAVVSFVLIAAAVYFFVVLPVNAIVARARRGEAPPDPTTKKCPECLSEVPIAARRCAFCTSPLKT